MLRTRFRKIVGDVWARKGRTALVSTAIFIGVLGTIALFSLSDIIVSQLQEDLKEDELAMVATFVTLSADVELDDAAYLETLRGITGITEVMATVQNNVYYKQDPAGERFEEGVITAFSDPYEEGLSIEPLRLLSGAYPMPGQAEIAVEQRMAERLDLSIGDQLYFRVLSPSQQEDTLGEIGTLEARTITGIVFHPYVFSPNNTVYSHPDDANYISGSRGFNLFSARFVDFAVAEAQSETFVSTLANQTPYIPVFTQVQDPANNQLIATAQTVASTMAFLALVALIVSGFLVINVISSIVVEQKRQIGVMKSMGASRWDSFLIYAGIAFVYGVIAVIPGVLLGIPAGNAAAHALAPTLNTVLDGFQVSPPSIVTGVLVGLLVPVLASIIPVYFGTRVRILDAMTDLGIDARYGSGWFARLIGALPISLTVRQGLSNVSLKKSRLAFTVITLSIAAGAFMGIFAVFSSLTSGIRQFTDTFNIQIGLIPNQGRDPQLIFDVLEENFQTGDNPVIASVEPGFQLQVEFEGYDPPLSAGGPPGIFAYGYDVNSDSPAFNFTVTEGEVLTDENAANGVILSSLLATNMDKGIGDTVVMRTAGNRVSLNVVGIADFPLDQLWIDWRTLALAAGYTIGAPQPNEYFALVQVDGFAGSMGDEVGVLGIDPEVPIGPLRFSQLLNVSDGEFFSEANPGVMINAEMAARGGFGVGDTLTLSATTAGGGSGEYPITGVFSLAPIIPTDELPDEFMVMFWRDLADLEGVTTEGRPLPQLYSIITTLPDPTAADLRLLIDDINEVMLDNGVPSTIVNFVEQIDLISQTFVTIQVILQLVAGLIALVGALGLLTTLSMSVFERQKEIGVMRSIGASSSTVATQFLTEGLVVGMIAWAVGIPLAYLIQVGLLSVTGFDETFPAEFSGTAVIIGLVGMLVITTIASLSPSISAARKTVSEVLRYQ